MSNLKEVQLEAFRQELAKTAAPNWQNIAGGVGALTGVGAAVGGLGGATIGAVKGYRDAKHRGESTLGAIGEGASGALGGGLKGAVVGAGAGASSGAAAGHLRPELASKLTQGETPILSSAARFGQRQMHGLTGWTPKEGLESIRGGTFEAKQRLEAAHKAMAGASEPKVLNLAMKERDAATKAVAAAEKAQQMGLTSVPGIVKSMRENGIGATLKADLSNQWAGAGLGAKAMMLGVPVAGMASTIASRDSVNEQGQGKGERLGSAVGGLLGGTVGSAVPIVGQMGLGTALSAAGQTVGRGIDRLRGKGGKGQFVPQPASAGSLANPKLIAGVVEEPK